jgi:hypothetical protein
MTAPATDRMSPTAALDRHAMGRGQGLPTVSVLYGPPGLAALAWRRWADGRGCRVAAHPTPAPEQFVPALVTDLAGQHDLTEFALRYLAARTGRTAADLRATFAGKTLHDLDQFWAAVPHADDRSGSLALARRLLRIRVAGMAVPPDQLGADLDTTFADCGRPWWRGLTALDGLLTLDERPALLFAPPADADAVAWLTTVAPALADLAESVPAWPVAVAVPAVAFDVNRQAAPESRAKALLTAGAVPIVALSAAAVADRLRARDVDPAGLAGPVRRLAAGGASEELTEAFAEAARTRGQPGDAARSAAERFLFELLESLTATTGQFTPNARLGFRFGHAPAEVDLCAVGLRLAVEIDGYYHFTDPERYRRDRRKDWELQRHGYVVLRVLADDVVSAMEEILDRILAAVEFCRRRPTPEGPPP